MVDGDYAYIPGDGVYHCGKRLDLTPSRHEIIGALMREAGNPLSRQVLAERLGYEGDRCTNLISVHLFHIKAATGGDRSPVESIHRVGLRWNPQNRLAVAA